MKPDQKKISEGECRLTNQEKGILNEIHRIRKRRNPLINRRFSTRLQDKLRQATLTQERAASNTSEEFFL